MVGGDVPSGALLAGAVGAAHPSAWEADEKTGVFNTTEGVLNTTHGGDRKAYILFTVGVHRIVLLSTFYSEVSAYLELIHTHIRIHLLLHPLFLAVTQTQTSLSLSSPLPLYPTLRDFYGIYIYISLRDS